MHHQTLYASCQMSKRDVCLLWVGPVQRCRISSGSSEGCSCISHAFPRDLVNATSQKRHSEYPDRLMVTGPAVAARSNDQEELS